MAIKQLIKIKHVSAPTKIEVENVAEIKNDSKNNKKAKKEKNMTNEEVNRAEEMLQNFEVPQQEVKVVKKDRGLIERTESSKIILTEDNRQVLID